MRPSTISEMHAMDAQHASDQMRSAIIGVIGTGSLALVSLADMEQYLRITSAALGVVIGLVSLYRMFRKGKRR